MKFTTSLFSQILQITPRVSFSQMVRQFGAERHAKGFSSWSQYVSMILPACPGQELEGNQ